MSRSSRPSRVRSSLWFIPVVCVMGALVLSAVTMAIDHLLDFKVIPEWMTGGPDAALGILTTIAASMVSLAALVLTITMVVVQLAMGQFSPRIVQTFLRDRPSQLAIGLFVATFAHAMLAMREIQFGEDRHVPGIAIVVSYLLVLSSIVMLVVYVHHIGRSLRVSALIELVGDDTRALLDEQYAVRLETGPVDPHVIAAPSSGVLTSIDRDRLVELATAAGGVLHVVPAVGSFVPTGGALLRIEGDPDDLDHKAATDALRSGLERTLDEDVAYGFRMLVDMAERALAESAFLDPTTAVQAIDRLHDGMRQLVGRRLPDGRFFDHTGALRLTVPVMDWDDYVQLVFDEIRLAGARSPQVTRRLVEALNDLLQIAPPERRPPLETQRRLLEDAVRNSPLHPHDIATALHPDPQGFGAADTRGNGTAGEAPITVIRRS